MIELQYAALTAVAVSGAATVLTRDPRRQAVVSGVYGLTLAILFLAFAAPDVALSQLVVGTLALPAMILLALAKIELHDQRGRR